MTPAPAEDGLVDLIVEEPGWTEELPDLAALADAAARAALAEQGLDAASWTIGLLACDDGRIAALNRDFRGRDRATNVLSWPAFALAPGQPGARPPSPPESGPGLQSGLRRPLGDVAIALQTTRREAAESATHLKDYAVHLMLHGCLHLLGFDHQTDEDAEMMEGIETRALARMGVTNPYFRGDAGQPRPDKKNDGRRT